ncbi:ATP-binding protein [Chamaesiphon sp.]|uniref:ATP-binding protein n=1 Tax=Chamaesiphon sp. TaxID=2814140 RepID=UPI003593C382
MTIISTAIDTGFPPALLHACVAQRLAYFESHTIAHPRLKEVSDLSLRTIAEPAGASFVFIYGASGVGKTTLRRRLEQKLTEAALVRAVLAPGSIPVAGIEAIAADAKNFDWKNFYVRSLMALNEPSINHKVDYGTQGIYRNLLGELIIQPKTVNANLRIALENALRHRKPDIFFIDEAQHLGKLASGRKLQDQMDSLKSLANVTGVLHGLLGTYELLSFRNLSGQLMRRSIDIHFRRYYASDPDDVRAFQSTLLSFQRQMSVLEMPDLVGNWEYCYERSLGCIGTLKDWLTKALKDALDEDVHTVTLKHLENRAWSAFKCRGMLKEIVEGEKQLSEEESDIRSLRMALGLDADGSNRSDEPPSAKSTGGSKQKVGQRKPKRDAIGQLAS